MFAFGDSLDLYAAIADATAGYWDSGAATGLSLVAGRFAGSQALQLSTGGGFFHKSSGQNDAMHHVVLAYRQTAALSGTTLGTFISFYDGATAQCSIVFRSDGTVLLTSGGPAGATLATYTGAVPLANQWYVFEFEMVINNTTGSFAARFGGAGSNSFSATALNTRGGTANNYANAMRIGQNATLASIQVDDLLWRSDPASVAWVGDIRCYVRMPASDQQKQFTSNPVSVSKYTNNTGFAQGAGVARYMSFVADRSGTIPSITLVLNVAYTGHCKIALFDASNGGNPGVILATSGELTNPAAGNVVFTFSSPPTVVQGTTYWVGVDQDASMTTSAQSGLTAPQSTTVYSSFPVASPSVSTTLGNFTFTVIYSINNNYSLVNEPQQDGATAYVYDSNVGDADFYGIAALAVTPASVVAVTTRMFAQKSDAGQRSGAVQLKSGAATVNSGSAALTTGWSWAYRTDLNDPATGSAWVPTGVNNVQIGPTLTA